MKAIFADIAQDYERAILENESLRVALAESLTLQSHYAGILNRFDGGNRLQFIGIDDWIERLRIIGKLDARP